MMVDFEELLLLTSRTFALAIPQLHELRGEVTSAYLLLRIADTLEDATAWPLPQRIAALRQLDDLLAHPGEDEARVLSSVWTRARPCDCEGYLRLLAALPELLSAIGRLAPPRRAAIFHHARRVAGGMAHFLSLHHQHGEVRVTSEARLRQYCYIVAGIVGELLTDLFLDVAPQLAEVESALRAHASAFGEGLQLVNILKDAEGDALAHHFFIPRSLGKRGALALALQDLDRAGVYIDTLQRAGAPRGIVAFCAFPVLLARATLRALDDRGAGAKLSRGEVIGLLQEMHAALDRGACALVG